MSDCLNVSQLLTKKWVCHSTMLYHYTPFPATLKTLQAKNNVRSVFASTVLTQVLH